MRLATQLMENPSMTDDLRQFEVVFCDSLEALAWARSKGLSASALIRSSAPAVLLTERRSEEIEQKLMQHQVSRFIAAINQGVAQIFKDLRASGLDHAKAMSAAYGFFGYHKVMRAALVLSDDDLENPRLVLRPRTGRQSTDRVLNPVWPELLSNNSAARILDVQVPEPAHGGTLGGRPPDFLERAFNLRPDRMLYRLLLAAYKRGLRLPGHGGDILIVRDGNELVRDTALAFALNGARILSLSVPKPIPAKIESQLSARVNQAVSRAFASLFADFYTPGVCAVVRQAASQRAEAELMQSVTIEEQWDKKLGEISLKSPGRRPIILHGFPNGGAGAGLHLAARRRGMRVVAFQHGVRREIANWELDTCILNESNCSDLMICYNDSSALYSGRQSLFSVADAVSIGVPSDYVRPIQRRPVASVQPLIYVSTLLYRGNVQISYTAVSDLERARREIALIDEVLSKLPFRVLYKPYPSFRYSDTDPVLQAAKAAKNIDVFTAEVDLRYIIQSHRMVMTSGATSTVGWCAASKLPLIFINDRDVGPLNGSARDLFGRAFHLFDRPTLSLHENLRTLLCRPLEEIETEARQRRHLVGMAVEQYLGFDSISSGRKAKNQIEDRFWGAGAQSDYSRS